MTSTAFVRQKSIDPMPAPLSDAGVWGWMRSNLFSSVPNALLTLFGAYMGWLVFSTLADFLLIRAVWSGDSRAACTGQVELPALFKIFYGTDKVAPGACWPFISAKFNLLIYGLYPEAQRWRVDIVYALGLLLMVPLMIPKVPYKRLNAFLFFIVYPILTLELLLGGSFGLIYVETRSWGGLLVTLVVAVTGIVASLPLGILLALGRRSELPIVRSVCITFIEFWRGVPLITVLFFAIYMLPLFLPQEWTIDNLLRALIGVTLFSAAYIAETVRGGLQAIPKGQFEGAMALGLNYWKMMAFIVLPQALKMVIPGIVNQFISLFKDTTLVLIVSIFDLLGILRAAMNDPNWATATTAYTGFAFTGIIYWIFCAGMSKYSEFLERRLNTSHRR
jgi:general L-amino acid transport system permease protein